MERKLNIKLDQGENGSVIVQWTDISMKPRQSIWVYILLTVFFLVSFFTSFFFGFWLLFFAFGVPLALQFYWAKPIEKFNSIEFGPKVTKFLNGESVPTKEISHIEYGDEEALTGARSKTALKTENQNPQTLIRLWVQDSYAMNISLNRWQHQVNHHIVDTLQKALEKARGK
jgi:hypothetical protein